MISVAMAAYKGEKYIKPQLESVLSQLCSSDEVIVSDDDSTDSLKTYLSANFDDSRIKYIRGPGAGVVKNFENAIMHCSGDIIFLCDQDDVWLPDKVSAVTKALDGCTLVLHDAYVTDEDLDITCESFFKAHGSGTGYLKNIIRNSYMGCCMAFRSELIPYILPFPDDIPMHDQWIGLAAEKHCKVKLLDKQLIYYRKHGNNVTGGKTSAKQKMIWRIRLIRDIRRNNID